MNESEKSEIYTIFMVTDIYQPIFVISGENDKIYPRQFLVALDHLDRKYLVSYLSGKNQRYRDLLEYTFFHNSITRFLVKRWGRNLYT